MHNLFAIDLCSIIIIGLKCFSQYWIKLDKIFKNTGFKNVLVQKNEDKVAVITSLNLSKKSGVIVAFVIYNGKTEAN